MEAVSRLQAWAVVGAANNIVCDLAAADALARSGVLFVPDVVASAGAVVDGVGESIMGLPDRTPLIDRLGGVAARILHLAERDACSTIAAAEALAAARLGRPKPLIV